MNKPETVTEAKVATLIRAAEAHLEHQRATAGAIQMSGTNPPRFVAIGTAAEIAQLLREDDEPATAASHPARRMRRGDRPTEPLQWEGESAPAATSGDAPTDLLAEAKDTALYLRARHEDDDGCPSNSRIGAEMIEKLVSRIERAAAPAPFAWMKPNEIAGLLNAASEDVETRHYGRIYARQYDADMVPVCAAAPALAESNMQKVHIAPATASGDELTTVECPTCKGAHRVFSRAEADFAACDDCDGQGRVIVSRADLAAVSAATKPTADCEHCGARLPLHLLTCPVAVKGMAEGKKKEAPEPLRQLLIDLSNNTYFCGLHLDDDAKYAGYMREAETAEQAIIDYFQSLLATKPAAVPEGAGIDANGTTYHNIAEIYHQAEECAALHMWLDDQGVPRADAKGKVFSPVGRVMGMVQDAARFRWLNADHDDADVREQARSLAKRLGTSSYFAITRDIDAAMLAAAPAAPNGGEHG